MAEGTMLPFLERGNVLQKYRYFSQYEAAQVNVDRSNIKCTGVQKHFNMAAPTPPIWSWLGASAGGEDACVP